MDIHNLCILKQISGTARHDQLFTVMAGIPGETFEGSSFHKCIGFLVSFALKVSCCWWLQVLLHLGHWIRVFCV